MRGRHLIAVPSPLGDLWLAGDGTHLTGLFIGPPPWATGGAPEASEASEAYVAKVAPFPAAVAQLGEYFAGRRRAFDLPLAPAGTPFQRRVWQALLDVPYGQTVTYGELAARLGRPGASRAVGAANGRNPIAIVIPCHRVVGAGGALTGYGGGLERKRWLLRLEAGALTPEPAFTCQRGLAGGG